MKLWGTARVDWREPLPLSTLAGWAAAVLWPPVVVTLVVFPPTAEAGGFLRDWRITELAAAAIGMAVTLRLIHQEQRRDGTPKTRLGVILRFLSYGFFFSLAAHVLLTLAQGVFALINPGAFFQRLGEFKAALLIGVASLPATLAIGVSHALWGGVIASVVAFKTRPPNARPGHYLYERMIPELEPAPLAPARPTPHPETAQEAGMRADLD